MTFEEFKELAHATPYTDCKSVFRIDVHRYVGDGEELFWMKVMCTQTFMCLDLQSVERRLQQFQANYYLRPRLYALYVYRFPVNKDIADDSYLQLWVYDRHGNLNGKSMCSRLKSEMDNITFRFRGHEAESIRFKPGDIVEVYDRMENRVKPAVVVGQPPTIDQCWNTRLEVEKACMSEGYGIENIDLVYDSEDCYCVVFGRDFAKHHSFPCSYDVFPSALQYIGGDYSQDFADIYRDAIENHGDEINSKLITLQIATERIKEIRRLVNLL